MPAVRQRVRHSARLQADARSRPKAMELPPPSIHIPPAGPKIIVHWTKPSDLHHTDTLVRHLSTNSADARVLFYEGKKTTASNNDERPSGKDKGEIHRFLAKLIFEKDSDYSAAYAEDPKKFDVVVGNRIVSLKKLFKEQLNKFNKTGAGVTPLDENAAANLHKQVLLEFPWYDQLHPILFSNPTCGAKIFTSQPGVDHARDFYALIHPRGGAGPSTNTEPPGPRLLQPDPRLLQPDPRLLQPDPRLLQPDPRLLQPDPRLLQLDPRLLQPDPRLLQPTPHLLPPNPRLPPPNPQPPLQDSRLPLPNQLDTGAQRSPPAYLPPSHHPPPHFTGAGGSPVDDPDGDLYDDPYADDNGPLSAPLGNAVLITEGLI
ncbi:hypothetical protein DFJ58DRAFT_729607 [Suillus subalutaceus]|uniref:uncharacterized protein n=1 Tax=Suillus subalutaceus TaxID=48586 RepID=UPI001B885A33|nr:uncharacterized protein DFJ58DRAFT_729607 [Suillus subalutaceus]KAG1849120.1 hypothetical protein DFJ58DRAFT_729607 [Suillus subalutaceus]